MYPIRARRRNISSQLEASCVQTYVAEYTRSKRLVKPKSLNVNRMSVGPLEIWVDGDAHELDGGRQSSFGELAKYLL